MIGEYNQFHCINGDQSCKPCSEVHHSCVGLPDGDNAVSGLTWTSYYITCLLNRTIGEHKCQKGVFDPNKRICTSLTAIGKTGISKYAQKEMSNKRPTDLKGQLTISKTIHKTIFEKDKKELKITLS